MDWLRIGWEGQTVLMHLMRKVNRNGELLDEFDDPAEDVALITGLPGEVVETGLVELVNNNVVDIEDKILSIVRFKEMQMDSTNPVDKKRTANADRQRRYRERRSGDPAYLEQQRAHNLVSGALTSGSLKKKPCEECGTTTNVVGHHDDYSKPLDVRWLCASHHRFVHVES